MRHSGASRSKNVGTSNRKTGESPVRRKIKVSMATIIGHGLVGPKGMAKAAPDGQKVNIPLLPHCAMEGRRVVLRASNWIDVWTVRMFCRQIRKAQIRAGQKCWDSS